MARFALMAGCGSVTAVGRVTQSSISQRSSQLEQKLGMRLLNRTTRPLNLTFAGERDRADPIGWSLRIRQGCLITKNEKVFVETKAGKNRREARSGHKKGGFPPPFNYFAIRLYFIRFGSSASAPSVRFLYSSYSVKLPSKKAMLPSSW